MQVVFWSGLPPHEVVHVLFGHVHHRVGHVLQEPTLERFDSKMSFFDTVFPKRYSFWVVKKRWTAQRGRAIITRGPNPGSEGPARGFWESGGAGAAGDRGPFFGRVLVQNASLRYVEVKSQNAC